MPLRPLRLCSHPGCPELVRTTRCEAHTQERERDKSADARRRHGSSYRRGYDAAWERVRERALKRDNFLCIHCLRDGYVMPARDVDHIIPFHGKSDPLRLDLDNLQSLCRPHHSEKSVKEDGGFGNKKKEHNGN